MSTSPCSLIALAAAKVARHSSSEVVAAEMHVRRDSVECVEAFRGCWSPGGRFSLDQLNFTARSVHLVLEYARTRGKHLLETLLFAIVQGASRFSPNATLQKVALLAAYGGASERVVREAIQKKAPRIVRVLLDNGWEATPEQLVSAVCLETAGNAPMTQLLLERGVNGGVAMVSLAHRGNLIALRCLHVEGVPVTYPAILRAAAARGHEGVVAFLVHNGAPVRKVFMQTARVGSEREIDVLFRVIEGDDRDAVLHNGLREAVAHGNVGACRGLVRAGAPSRDLILDAAVAEDRRGAETLLQAGGQGTEALRYTLSAGHFQNFAFLVGCGAPFSHALFLDMIRERGLSGFRALLHMWRGAIPTLPLEIQDRWKEVCLCALIELFHSNREENLEAAQVISGEVAACSEGARGYLSSGFHFVPNLRNPTSLFDYWRAPRKGVMYPTLLPEARSPWEPVARCVLKAIVNNGTAASSEDKRKMLELFSQEVFLRLKEGNREQVQFFVHLAHSLAEGSPELVKMWKWLLGGAVWACLRDRLNPDSIAFLLRFDLDDCEVFQICFANAPQAAERFILEFKHPLWSSLKCAFFALKKGAFSLFFSILKKVVKRLITCQF